jgi:hypothetical protein
MIYFAGKCRFKWGITLAKFYKTFEWCYLCVIIFCLILGNKVRAYPISGAVNGVYLGIHHLPLITNNRPGTSTLIMGVSLVAPFGKSFLASLS